MCSSAEVPIEAIAYIEMIKANNYAVGIIKHRMEKDLGNIKETCSGV